MDVSRDDTVLLRRNAGLSPNMAAN
jgi:hypothetical protein